VSAVLFAEGILCAMFMICEFAVAGEEKDPQINLAAVSE
jgi:hypothetical protein